MSELLLLIFYCALLGSGVGFLAGLLGIGGGLIIVPVLSSILLYLEVLPSDQVVVAAIATSLASILFTSTSSALAHHKNGNVPWDLAPWIMLGVALGALISGFMAALLPEKVVRIVFAVSVVLIAIKMFLSSKNDAPKERKLPNKGVLTVLTTITGGLSAMIGIGGGALLVPLLTFFSVDMKKAIGCASACGIVIALFWLDRLHQFRQQPLCSIRWLCWLCLSACAVGYCVHVLVYGSVRRKSHQPFTGFQRLRKSSQYCWWLSQQAWLLVNKRSFKCEYTEQKRIN